MSASTEDSLSASTMSATSNNDEEQKSIHPNPDILHSDSSTSTQFGTISRRMSKWRPKKRKTVLAVIVATIGAFALGNVLTFSATVLDDPLFKEKFPDIGNGSWVATIFLLGALLSAPISGVLIAKTGRRCTMLISALPLSAGWAMIAFAPNLAVLYTGRFLTGFCGGAFTVAVPAYVAEVSEDRIRGTLAVSFILMLCVGILFTYILGAFVSWFVLSVVCACIPIIFFFCMLCMPESPRYLIQAQKPAAARNALKWLRRASTKRYIEPEISKIEDSVNRASNNQNNNGQASSLCTARVLKPVGISCMLMFFGQFSGMNGMSLYTTLVFKETGSGMDAKTASIIIGATQALAVLIVPLVLVDKLGRKTLLIISELVMVLSLAALGTFFLLKERNDGEAPGDLASWLPLTSIIFFYVGYNVGLGPIPWVVVSEILPNDVKEMSSALISISYWAMQFVAGKSFQDIKDLIGNSGVYWLSSAICLAGAFFVFFLVPETKGKSSDEIQKLFKSKSSIRSIPPRGEKAASIPEGVDNPAFYNQDP